MRRKAACFVLGCSFPQFRKQSRSVCIEVHDLLVKKSKMFLPSQTLNACPEFRRFESEFYYLSGCSKHGYVNNFFEFII